MGCFYWNVMSRMLPCGKLSYTFHRPRSVRYSESTFFEDEAAQGHPLDGAHEEAEEDALPQAPRAVGNLAKSVHEGHDDRQACAARHA